MTRSEEGFKKQERIVNSIDTANNQSIKLVAKGLVELDIEEGSIKVQDVLLDLVTNLLSISKICKQGMKIVFTSTKCEVVDNEDGIIASGTEEDGLCRLNLKKAEHSFLTVDSNIWHKRLGHLNQQSMMKLLSMAEGIRLKKQAIPDCAT
ncbi:uncharacterized protein LOC134222804 [Armigeres subalbatus]|uniref:uncharacterized protein LOC134222804 n=1 Tax=Armigeres subalbatus TaxID=124917 RepID=UPI002ED4F50C